VTLGDTAGVLGNVGAVSGSDIGDAAGKGNSEGEMAENAISVVRGLAVLSQSSRNHLLLS
jgi:hypothetical protein